MYLPSAHLAITFLRLKSFRPIVNLGIMELLVFQGMQMQSLPMCMFDSLFFSSFAAWAMSLITW